MADVTRIVIYTPMEDFWYNGPGSALVVWGIGMIISVAIGYGVSSYVFRKTWNPGKAFHVVAAVVSAVIFAIYHHLVII